ncbi:MAG TPA: tRNA glutamyl-Q(34) synthetase GluQRS [Piscirickettsiaceae bacterium]|nr:tRNA glutamyl-Q(34) synthetase GluQRS [Piscirickettsiaceae bacterium]HIQ41086.1 tRNA glutamyl-Q(34) synthetase GluQRS [Sulfurivirga caldicuralii]
MQPVTYRGRFAPSPNGPLHFGSLVAATASYLDARAHQGEWWIRIDDIDPPRVVPGATDAILRTLEGFGFQWHGVVFQSQRHALYQAAFEQLDVYPCYCSRREVFTRDPSGSYHGFCRMHSPLRRHKPPAWRLRLPYAADQFHDLIQGLQQCNCHHAPGEFVLKRADGVWGYHLACAVDEIEMGITHVIRGADLLYASFAQRQVIHGLKRPPPAYGHHPLVLNREGIKLSKRARAQPIDPKQASRQLWHALDVLGQQPPAELKSAPMQTLWQWAIQHYHRAAIPPVQARTYDFGTA